MTYIRCPHCGAKALNVATMCPQCRAPLSQNPMEAGRHGLEACRRCRKFIERDAEVCPFCGYHVRRGRTVRRWVIGVTATLAMVGGAGYALVAAGGFGGVIGWVAAPARSPGTTAPSVPAEPVRAAPLVPDLVTVEPMLAATPAPPRRAPASLVIRYARSWANVRSGRSTDSGVVAVLRPGDRVQVGEFVNGWWAVWSDTTRVGFVATDLLSATPPADSLP